MISSTPPQQCLDNGFPRGYGSCKKHFERPPDYREKLKGFGEKKNLSVIPKKIDLELFIFQKPFQPFFHFLPPTSKKSSQTVNQFSAFTNQVTYQTCCPPESRKFNSPVPLTFSPRAIRPTVITSCLTAFYRYTRATKLLAQF